VSTENSAHLNWFKSTYSSGEGGACVEVASDQGTMRIRDSKQRSGPQLAVTHGAWTEFITHVAMHVENR
jgi:hypothetical protein